MWSKVIVFIAVSCVIWANMAQAYPQSQGQGPCGPKPSGPPPSGPPPSGMPPRNGRGGGPCGPPPSGSPPAASTTAASAGYTKEPATMEQAAE